MAKQPTVTSVPQTTTNTVTINNNFSNVKEAFNNTLSLDGSTPNAMQADFDMDSNDILNVGNIDADSFTKGGVDYMALITEAGEEVEAQVAIAVANAEATAADRVQTALDAAQAAASAAAAATSEANAATSETNAATSEANAAASKTQAELAAIAAQGQIVSSLTDPTPSDGTIELVAASPGYVVWEVQSSTWTSLGYLGPLSFTARSTPNATICAAMPDGTIVEMAGLKYEVDSTATGTASATNDLSVDGLIAFAADGWVSPLQFSDTIRAGIIAAQAAGFKTIRIPRCDENWAGAVEVFDGVTIEGCGIWSKINMTGTNASHFYASSRADVKISALYLNGNLTGSGGTAAGAAGGHGVNFNGCTDVEVSGCVFDNIGRTTTGSYASCVWGNDVDGVKVKDCFFLADNGGGVANIGADINLAYYCKNTEITGNHSVSEQDTYISVAAVGAGADDTEHHRIHGNFGSRSDASVARSGIIAPYNAKSLRATISGNILINFPANGIYMSAGANNTDDTAAASIFGNIIRYCGGSSAMLNISAGLYLSGRGGASAVGNIIEHSGRRSDGTARTYPVAGILINGSTRGVSTSANQVRFSTGAGIEVRNVSGGTDMSDVSIRDDILFDNERGGVEIVHALASATISRLHIVGTIITQVDNDFDGITYNRSSGALNIPGLRIDDNTITAASGTTKYGLTTNVSGFALTSIKGNHFVGWVRGLWFSSAGITDKEIGNMVVLSENGFENCATGIAANIGAGKYALHFNSTFSNCSAETLDASRILAAARLGGGRYEVRRTAAPADGAWLQGDKVLRPAPAASGFIGDACVTDGSPGTWKTYGPISA